LTSLLSSLVDRKRILLRKERIVHLSLQESRSHSHHYHEELGLSKEKNAKLFDEIETKKLVIFPSVYLTDGPALKTLVSTINASAL
jgi:hypothetical protein